MLSHAKPVACKQRRYTSSWIFIFVSLKNRKEKIAGKQRYYGIWIFIFVNLKNRKGNLMLMKKNKRVIKSESKPASSGGRSFIVLIYLMIVLYLLLFSLYRLLS